MNVKIVSIDGKRYKVRKVTGEIARILTGRNSYWVYYLIQSERRKIGRMIP